VRAIAAPIPPEDLCIACFSGQYPSDIPDDALRDRYAKRLIRVGELQ
jgi:glutamine phosphoribosylpyrophosphate amidotransferase